MPIEYLPSAFARVALDNVARAYPRRLDQLLAGPDAEWRPGVLHPAFYGSYDWHSAVHMHWSLARLLRLHPAIPERRAIEARLALHLSTSAIGRELAFFDSPGGLTFERPYGWAWLLELQAELIRLQRWHREVAPLADALASRFVRFFETSAYPVRAGTHGNTAFAAILAFDYARTAEEASSRRRSNPQRGAGIWAIATIPLRTSPRETIFYPRRWSKPCLMKRILADGEFREWLTRFLPRDLEPLSRPPTVLDHADAKQSHLDGLCLSRAWCFTLLGSKTWLRSTWGRECRTSSAATTPASIGSFPSLC